MPTDEPKRQLSPEFGHETPFPVGREYGPDSWMSLEDAQTDGIPTGLPWNLTNPEAVVAEAEKAAAEAEHTEQPDSTRLHFGLMGLVAGLFLGWIAATWL